MHVATVKFLIFLRPFCGGFHHVCSAEYLYLENIYSKRELFKMGISEFEVFFAKIKVDGIFGRVLQ